MTEFELVYQNQVNEGDPDERVPVVSFFTEDEYYAKSAERLQAELARQGLAFSIFRLVMPERIPWYEITKKKIFLYEHVRKSTGAGFLFVDVDTEIVGDLRPLLRSGADLSGFLRNFARIGAFNSGNYARLLHPGYLRFSGSETTGEFIEFLVSVAEAVSDPVTDDWVLQEGISGFTGPLSLHVYPSQIIAKTHNSRTKDTVIVHGDSENVQGNRALVLQHVSANARKETASIGKIIEHLRGTVPAKHLVPAYEYARERKLMSPATLTRYLRTLRGLKRPEQLKEVVEWGLAPGPLQAATSKFYLEYLLKFVGREDAEMFLVEQRDVLTEHVCRMADSLLFKYSYSDYPRKPGGGEVALPMYWWDKPYPGNFGDVLNPYLVSRLTGRKINYVTGGRRLQAMGSILKFADRETAVWGSGLPRLDSRVDVDAMYFAVRGPMTRDVILASGGSCPVVYGDPALLLPRVYQPLSLREKKTHRVGLILHHNHSGYCPGLPDGWRLIDIITKDDLEIEGFVEQLCSCEVILSTSLHGIIVAHAYGIPAVWCDVEGLPGQVPGDGMKFYDYYESVGVKDPRCYVFGSGDPVSLPQEVERDPSAFLPACVPDLDVLRRALDEAISSLENPK